MHLRCWEQNASQIQMLRQKGERAIFLTSPHVAKLFRVRHERVSGVRTMVGKHLHQHTCMLHIKVHRFTLMLANQTPVYRHTHVAVQSRGQNATTAHRQHRTRWSILLNCTYMQTHWFDESYVVVNCATRGCTEVL